jgi:hypothetical protein
VKTAVKSERESQIWEMSLKGCSCREIGAEIGLSHQGVWKILRRVEERERARLSKRYLSGKATQYARLERIIKRTDIEYEESLKPRQRVRTTQNASGEEVTLTEAYTPTPNLACLTLQMQAMESQRRLIGWDVEAAAQDPGSVAAIAVEAMTKRGDEDTASSEPGGLLGGIPDNPEHEGEGAQP